MKRSLILILISFFFLTVKAERLLAGEEQTANIELTDANFDELVTNSKDFWLIDFFAPWCPPCKILLPEWKKAANVLDGKIKMGTVNCDEQKGAAGKYPIPHYPTVYFLGADKTTPIKFGGRDVQSIEKEALEKIESQGKEGTANIELTDANFDELVTNSKDFWLVDFFAPWCPPCKILLPEWKKAANVLEGKIKMGTVNCDEQKGAAGKYPIPHFPTVYFLGADKTTPIKFGGRDVQSIEKEALEKIESQSNPVKAERLLAGEEQTANIELTDANFDELVTNSKDFWLVDFFAPWCPPCKALLPEWKKAANVLEGKVKMGSVNCDEQKGAASKYPLQGYPTVYIFGADKTRPVIFYGRNVQAIEEEALWQIKTLNDPAEVIELTSQEVFTAKCPRGCFVAFLEEEGRAKNLDTLLKVAEKHKPFHGFSYVWAAAGKQPELEKHVGVSTFPGFVVLDTGASLYVTFNGAWEVDPMIEFAKNCGRQELKPCTGAATVVTTPPSHPKYEL